MACDSDDGDDETTPVTCEFDGVTYEVGDSFGATDGCNTCTCGEDGEAACTLLGCPEPTCTEEECGPALGMPNYLCPDGVTTAGPGPCEVQEDETCGWTVVQCPDVYDPCDGLACGQACSACPPEDDTCSQTAEEKACNNEGVCEGSFDASQCGPVNLCEEEFCELWEAFCEGDLLHSAGVSLCDPLTGECSQNRDGAAKAPTLCTHGCQDGACNDPCAVVDCADGTECVDGQCIETCAPGDSFDASDGCNTCFCSEEGLKTEDSCTEMDCTDQCTPGAEFLASDGCNTCTCPESGLKAEAGCTKKACVCASSDDCGGTAYCDFSGDDCGAWGNSGICKAAPTECVAGGPGTCGCDGSWANNDCELNALGVDYMKYGGCQGPDPVALFACGEASCDLTTELCNISMNDAMGDDEPEYYANCSPLPEGCSQGDCACLDLDQWSECYDGHGVTMAFYPGG
jgi:hypothetical protein